MATRRRNKVLGVALGEDVARVAEVVSAGGRPRLARVGEFRFPAGVGLAQPAVLGAALGQFLQRQGFSARAAVVGVREVAFHDARGFIPLSRAYFRRSLNLVRCGQSKGARLG